jgi:formate transporter
LGAKETWLRSVMAGICIAVGGAVNLSVDNKVVGAALFSTGLFTICTLGYYLYTGKVCYLLDSNQKGKYLLWLGQIWAGNLIGTALVGYGLRLTRTGTALAEKAQGLCQAKLNDSLLSIFILSVLCNLMIYIAVENYKNNPHPLGKYLAIFLGVMVSLTSSSFGSRPLCIVSASSMS